MARAPLREVRWLTLQQLSEPWAWELNLRQDLVLHELRLGIINFGRIDRGDGLLPELPLEDDLPSPHEFVDRDWIRRFARKQRWPLPKFWFQDAAANRRPGAPGYQNWKHIEQELERRIIQGEDEESWRAESNYLVEWIARVFPQEQPPAAKTIRNRLDELRKNLIAARK